MTKFILVKVWSVIQMQTSILTPYHSKHGPWPAPHSSTLAWKIPWVEEPGRLRSMGSWRVGHNWVTSLSLFPFMHWRRKWQPTPVFLPGESQGWGSLVGCHLWGRTESDTTEMTQQQQQQTLGSTPDLLIQNLQLNKTSQLNNNQNKVLETLS